VLALSADEREVVVHDNWENSPGASVEVDGRTLTREDKLKEWVLAVTGEAARLRKELGYVATSLNTIATISEEAGPPVVTAAAAPKSPNDAWYSW